MRIAFKPIVVTKKRCLNVCPEFTQKGLNRTQKIGPIGIYCLLAAEKSGAFDSEIDIVG